MTMVILRPVLTFFVLKLDAAATLVYATYLGGNGHDWATGITIDLASKCVRRRCNFINPT